VGYTIFIIKNNSPLEDSTQPVRRRLLGIHSAVVQEAFPEILAVPTFRVLFCITDRFYVGQNLYISYSWGITPNGTQNWATAVQKWYNEVALFSKDSVSPFQ
jgi:hypothetical protein